MNNLATPYRAFPLLGFHDRSAHRGTEFRVLKFLALDLEFMITEVVTPGVFVGELGERVAKFSEGLAVFFAVRGQYGNSCACSPGFSGP